MKFAISEFTQSLDASRLASSNYGLRRVRRWGLTRGIACRA